MDSNNNPDKPETPRKERSIPMKWVFLAILVFAIGYHIALWMGTRQ